MSARDSVVAGDNFFIYQYWRQGVDAQGERVSVVFLTRNSARSVELVRLLRQHLELTYAPHRIVFLATSQHIKKLIELAQNPDVANTPNRVVGAAYENEIEIAEVEKSGRIFAAEGGNGHDWTPQEADELFAAGLALIFIKNGAALDSRGKSYHYVTPSGRHQSTFVRVGNVFADGNQTSFAASALLRLVPQTNFDSIYIDSSTIGSLAYELSIQLYELRGLGNRPLVNSFGGYTGIKLRDQPMPTADSLVLISYSATGRLAEVLRGEVGLGEEASIVNVYSDGTRNADMVASCYLDTDNGVGEQIDLSSDSVDPSVAPCELCARGSSRIVIVGDQLLPMSPVTRLAEIKPANGPSGLFLDMRDLVKYEAVRVNARLTLGATFTREIYLDLSKLAIALDKAPNSADGSVLISARERLSEAESKENTWLIHVDDAASMEMARIVRRESNRMGAEIREEQVLSAKQFLYAPNTRPSMGDGIVVVLAGAVASGRSLELLSEVLRSVHAGGLIHYVILFARAESEDAWKKSCSNLEFGEGKPHRHRLTAPQHIELPPTRKDQPTPWERERMFWRTVLDDGPPVKPSMRKLAEALIESRIDQIGYFEPNEDENQPGVRDTLFLAGYGGNSLATDPSDGFHLKLTPNFSFWKFGYARIPPVQADVYVTFAATLNRMRNRHGNIGPLIDQSHDRTCIDPTDFGRYTDAVAQAAILRSATPVELDYSGDYELSAAMFTMLERQLVKPQTDGGNALPEFLLAIAMGTLRLHRYHVDQLVALMQPIQTTGELAVKLLATLALSAS
jgi:hypothetical protein